VLCSLLWVTLLGQGVGLGDPQRSLPTPAMLGSCEQSSLFALSIPNLGSLGVIPSPALTPWVIWG